MKRIERSAAGIFAAVFLSGAVLLGLELVASRVVAPFFGSSIFVWGALIGVVLAGLSVGYWIGGRLADRFRRRCSCSARSARRRLILLIPVVDGWVLEQVVRNAGPRWNPLVATIVLFGLPSIVLATATPIAVRLRARLDRELGKTAGRLFAVSTAGSIVGTFATAFFLIPELGTNQLLGVLATALRRGRARRPRRGRARAGLSSPRSSWRRSGPRSSLEPKQGGASPESPLRTGRRGSASSVSSRSPLLPMDSSSSTEEHALPRPDRRR